MTEPVTFFQGRLAAFCKDLCSSQVLGLDQVRDTVEAAERAVQKLQGRQWVSRLGISKWKGPSIHVCVYLYTHTQYTFIHISTYVYIHIYIYIYCLYLCITKYTYMCVYIYIHVRMYIYVYVMYIHVKHILLEMF